MKTLFIFMFIVSSSKYTNAQFGDDQNRWESSEQKLLKFESKDERPQQHNFFSSRYNDLHHNNDNAQNYYNLNDGNFNSGFGIQYSTSVNTESDISSDLSTRLELQSRLIGFNRNNQKSEVSIGPDEPHIKYNSYGTQKRLNVTDYNIFNSKSTIKYQTESSTNKHLKAASDQNSKYKNITILILDESNKILKQLSVPMLNTSHIIIKTFSNDLQSEKITSNEKTSQGHALTTNEQKTIPSAFGKSTYSSTYSHLLDHSEPLNSTPPPLKNSSGDIIKPLERNLIIDSNTKYPKQFIPLNNRNNEVIINNKNKAGEEQFNYFRTTLPEAIENHSERMSPTTVHSVGMNTNGVKTTIEQQASTSSISLHPQQISGTVHNGPAGVKLGSQSSIEPTILKMIESFTEQNTFPNTQSSKRNRENITKISNQNNIDLTTEIPVDFFTLTGTTKEAVIINKSPPGGQDLHLSLKPARLEIIEENTDRTKNVSSKNHFVNVFVPTLEFTQSKNNSMKADDQYNALGEDKMKTSGKFKLDSSTQNEKISSMPVENTELEIKSSRPEGLNQDMKKGLGHSEANDIFSQFVSVGSKVTVPEISSVTLKFPTSISSINQLQSSPSSLEEETNILMDILLGQQNESTIASYNKYSSMTTTEHHLTSYK